MKMVNFLLSGIAAYIKLMEGGVASIHTQLRNTDRLVYK